MSNKFSVAIRKKYVWVPSLLLAYLGIMAWIGRDRITKDHDYLGYFSIAGVELLIIVGVFFFLRKKEQLKERRRLLDKKSEEIIKDADSPDFVTFSA